MTKRDLKSLGWAAALASLVGGVIYFLGVRKRTIAELNPVEINWEGP